MKGEKDEEDEDQRQKWKSDEKSDDPARDFAGWLGGQNPDRRCARKACANDLRNTQPTGSRQLCTFLHKCMFIHSSAGNTRFPPRWCLSRGYGPVRGTLCLARDVPHCAGKTPPGRDGDGSHEDDKVRKLEEEDSGTEMEER